MNNLETLATEVLGLIQAQTGPVEGQLTSAQFEEAVKAAASRIEGGAEQAAVQNPAQDLVQPDQTMVLMQLVEERNFLVQSIELTREKNILGDRLIELAEQMRHQGLSRSENERVYELMVQYQNAIQQGNLAREQRERARDLLEKRRFGNAHLEALRQQNRLMITFIAEFGGHLPAGRPVIVQNQMIPPVPPPTAAALPAPSTGPRTAPASTPDDEPIQPRVTRSQTAQIPANNTRSKRTGAGNSGNQQAKKQKKLIGQDLH